SPGARQGLPGRPRPGVERRHPGQRGQEPQHRGRHGHRRRAAAHAARPGQRPQVGRGHHAPGGRDARRAGDRRAVGAAARQAQAAGGDRHAPGTFDRGCAGGDAALRVGRERRDVHQPAGNGAARARRGPRGRRRPPRLGDPLAPGAQAGRHHGLHRGQGGLRRGQVQAAVHEGGRLGARAAPRAAPLRRVSRLTMEYGSLGFNVISAVIKIAFMILGFLMPLASILTWMERRQSAMMQDRLGPNRANIGPLKLFGILHFVAYALKFMGKEDYVPGKAHKFLFMWAPIMAMAPALIVAAIIPFGAPLCWGEMYDKVGLPGACSNPVGLQISQLNVGLLFYFAIASLSVYGATLAGWASHNKWSMMGGLRASSQMMSYEVTLGMAVLGAFLVYGTLEP